MITPRPYLSYSQYNAFHYSKQKFLDRYYYGKEEPDNCYLEMGKKLGTAIRFRYKRENKTIRDIRKQIPEYPIYEHEMKAVFKNIPLLGYLDGYDPHKQEIMELKTGKKPSVKSWIEQQLFYTTIYYIKYKKLPNKITLYWCETNFNEDEQLVLTGKVKAYNIKIDIKQMLMFTEQIVKTWEGIKKLCEQEYQKFGVMPTQRSNTRNNIK